MDTKEKTKLERLLFERGITIVQVQKVISTKQPGTAAKKIHRITEFKCSEMKKLRDTFFPEMSLEELFEGY